MEVESSIVGGGSFEILIAGASEGDPFGSSPQLHSI